MRQLDFLSSSEVDLIHEDLQKTKYSMSKQFRALFALLSEVQEKIISMEKEKMRKDEISV
jgi:hypothetical protein